MRAFTLLLAAVLALPLPGTGQSVRARERSQERHFERVSVSSRERQANARSSLSGISDNGNRIVFSSEADNLVPRDTNDTSDLFIRFRKTGRTRRVNVWTNGDQMGMLHGSVPAFSGNGRWVAFSAYHSGDEGRSSLFLRDLKEDRTIDVDRHFGAPRDRDVGLASSLSWNGRFLAFISNGVVPRDRTEWWDAYVWDRRKDKVSLVSLTDYGSLANGDTTHISLDASGGCATMSSWAKNLDPRHRLFSGNSHAMYIRDLAHGGTRIILPRRRMKPSYGLTSARLSGDGNTIAFSWRGGLLPGGDGKGPDVYIRDLRTGKTTRVNEFPRPTRAEPGAMSGSGRRMILALEPNHRDVVVDLPSRRTMRLDPSPDGRSLRSSLAELTLSRDGSAAAVSSTASNLVAGDTNDHEDVFVMDLGSRSPWSRGRASDGCGGKLKAKPTPRCFDRPAHFVGMPWSDTIGGGAGNDVLMGMAGDDGIGGSGPGVDRLCGGPGDDGVIADDGDDRLFGGPGNDHLEGGGGRDVCFGGSGDDRLEGCEIVRRGET